MTPTCRYCIRPLEKQPSPQDSGRWSLFSQNNRRQFLVMLFACPECGLTEMYSSDTEKQGR